MGSISSTIPCSNSSFFSLNSSTYESTDHQRKVNDFEFRLREKWLKLDLGLDISECPIEEIQYLLETKIAFAIAFYQRSTTDGKENHKIKQQNGNLFIKMEDDWKSVKDIQQEIRWDEHTNRLCSINSIEEGWNYVSPIGLTKRDRFDYDFIYPIEKLDSAMYEQAIENAKKYDGDILPTDEDEEQNCVFQIVTTARDRFSRSWYTENALNNAPEHVSFRIIDQDGFLYSGGFEMKKDQGDIVGKICSSEGFLRNFLSTSEVCISVPDYEEMKPCDARRVTSIPLSMKRKDAMLEFVSALNQTKARFNFVRQNCCKLCVEMLRLAGVVVDPTITFADYLNRIVPNVEYIPTIGPALSTLVHTVRFVAYKIFDTLVAYTPNIIRTYSLHLYTAIYHAGLVIWTIAANSFATYLGAMRMTKPLKEEVEDNRENSEGITNFSCLIRNFTDFFDPSSSNMCHSVMVKEWQLKQKSTEIYLGSDIPKLYI